jgi:hypothetical protein
MKGFLAIDGQEPFLFSRLLYKIWFLGNESQSCVNPTETGNNPESRNEYKEAKNYLH